MSVGYYQDDYEPPFVSIWQRINRLLWVLLILTVLAIIIGAFMPELQKQRNERKARETLRAAIAEQRVLKSRHERELGWLNHSPEYLAAKAGDLFDLMPPTPGTKILRVDPDKAPAFAPAVPAAPESGRSLRADPDKPVAPIPPPPPGLRR